MDKKWYRSWKKFTNYKAIKSSKNKFSFIKSNYNPSSFTPDRSDFPGNFDNSDLLVPLTEFLNDGDQTKPENIVVKTNYNSKEHFTVLFPEQYEFFESRYKGGPTIRKGYYEVKSEYYNKPRRIEQIYDIKIDIRIFHPFGPIAADLKETFTIYVPLTYTIIDLKTHIARIISDSRSLKEIRLWKMNTFFEQKHFVDLISDVLDVKKVDSQDELVYLECVFLSRRRN